MVMEDSKVWKENFRKLKAYHQKYGSFNVSGESKEKLLARWVENIRRNPERLPANAYKALTKLGFQFQISNDWNTMFGKLESFYRKHGHTYVPSNEHALEPLFDWTAKQRLSRSLLTAAQIQKLDSVQFDWETRTPKDIQWNEMYRELIDFKKKYGHTKVPQDFPENRTLGSWVSRQRSSKTRNILSAERIKLLQQIGFLWKEDIAKLREDLWDTRYKELVQYKKSNGHIDRIQVRKDYFQLGLWVETQIKSKDKLSAQRRKKLDAIGFIWHKEDFAEQRWQEMYTRLKAYKLKHGHCQVKQRDDFKLAVWLQRNKRDKNIISSDKRKKLEQLGVKWPHELFQETWENMYRALKNFKTEHKHLVVPRNEARLYEWIQTQKRLKAENRLNKMREQKLTALGFIWKGEAAAQKLKAWDVMYTRFAAFQKKHGARYHIKLKEHAELDEWVRLQLHSKGKLSAYKKEKLNAIHFLWDRSGHYWDERWERMYEALVVFKRKHGHCDVPQKYPPDQSLASWVNGQRMKKLSPEKKKKLMALGFSWKNEISEKRWMQRVEEFLQYKKMKKPVPHHTPLYSWIYQQRKNFKKLTSEKKAILIRAKIVGKD
jgi:hypothetical protein